MAMIESKLVLSLFPGADLLGRAFAESGYCVVKGPDAIFHETIKDFSPPPGKFEGIIGGPPCVDFSTLNRNPGTYSNEMLQEYKRCVEQARPEWWLMENVAGVPNLKIDGYGWQRFELDLGWFTPFSRLRHFQFGHQDGITLSPVKGLKQHIIETAVSAHDRRSFGLIRDIQGLPGDYDLPLFNKDGKKKLVGNGVPMVLGRYLTQLIHRDVYQSGIEGHWVPVEKQAPRRCECGCGRVVGGRAMYASAACRKRAERTRKTTQL